MPKNVRAPWGLRAAVFAACLLPLLFALGGGSAGAPAAGSSDQEDLAAKLKGMEPRAQLQYLERLEEEGKGGALVQFHMGNAMYALGDLDSAAVFYERAVKSDSTFSKAWVNLGIVFDSQNVFFKAKAAFESALRADPNDVLAYCHLGFLKYSKQQYGEAIEDYEKALSIDPESAQAHYYLGLAFADAHVFREALREWELVVKMQPDTELGATAKENVRLINQYLKVRTP
jgi:tetratricopeptide (TPR) repeat protein